MLKFRIQEEVRNSQPDGAGRYSLNQQLGNDHKGALFAVAAHEVGLANFQRLAPMRRCCTARSKTLTSLCRSLIHPAQYVSGIPSPVILLSISTQFGVQLVASPTFESASQAR